MKRPKPKAESGEGDASPAEVLESFPGLFKKGSELDISLISRRRFREQNPGGIMKLVGEQVEYGLFSEMEFEMAKWVMPLEQVNSPLAEAVDIEFLDKIDYRLRFCRAVLSMKYAISWDESGKPVWTIADPPQGDPLDQIGVDGTNFAVGTQEYYALKLLRHFRRFEMLYDSGETESIGIWRELIRFGEIWAEARFVLNMGKHSITGKKQNKVLDDQRNTANARQREKMMARREAIAILLREMNRPLTGGALENYLRKGLLDRFDIKASLRTIRRDLTEILHP